MTHLAKIQLLTKKIQDRKTAEIFEDESFDYVTDILELSESQDMSVGAPTEEPSTVVPVSILSTMKSIAHTIQSKARWEKFAADRGGDSAVYTFSSRGDFSNWRDVVLAISRYTRPARHIAHCTLKLRMEQNIEIAREIEDRNKESRRKRILSFYFDELDKYIVTLRPLIEELARFDCVGKIVIVTATPASIWSSHPGWDRLFVLNPRIEHDDGSYLMFKECQHINADDYMSGAVPPRTWAETPVDRYRKLIDYHHRLIMSHPDLMTPGRVIFAPGLEARESHERVARFWTHMGCSVFVLNGERTSAGFYGRLYLCDGSVVDVQHSTYDMLTTPQLRAYAAGQGFSPKSQAQLNDVLANLYWEHNLHATPLVMTGLLCVERAQSLVHPVWGTFTDGIYSWARNADDAYQQQRQLGHIKKWDTYRGVPRIFAPERYRQDVLILEQRVHRFAERHGGATASVADFISAGGGALTSHEQRRVEKEEKEIVRKNVEMSIQQKSFSTLKDAVVFLKTELGRDIRIGDPSSSKRSAFHDIDKYLVSTRLLSYYKKKTAAELVAEDRLTEEKFNRISRGMNISQNKGQHYMIYAVYPTMMSSPEEVQFYVRYLPSAEMGTKPDVITHA